MKVSRLQEQPADECDASRILPRQFRLTQHELPQGVDLILIPKLGTDEPDFEALKASLVALAQQAAKKLGPKP